MYPDYGTDPVIPTAAEPEPSPEACDCGLRVDEDADVRGEHHMRRCPRFAFAPAVTSDPDEELSLLLALEQQVRALISRPTPDLRLRSVSEITLAALDDLRREKKEKAR